MSATKTGIVELFSSVTSASDLRIIQWTVTEAICAPFQIELVAVCAPTASKDLADALLGQNAVFVQHHEGLDREARRGVIAEARVEGDHKDQGRVRLTLVPRLGLSAMRVHSRIFQDQTVPQILATHVGEWQLDHEMMLG